MNKELAVSDNTELNPSVHEQPFLLDNRAFCCRNYISHNPPRASTPIFTIREEITNSCDYLCVRAFRADM